MKGNAKCKTSRFEQPFGKLCIRLFSTEVDFFLSKKQNRALCHLLRDVGVTYVYGSSMARWKARGRTELFSPALTIEAL